MLRRLVAEIDANCIVTLMTATEQDGSKGRVSFESDLKAEIDRLWIGRKG